MDEPTVGIDPQSRSHILDTVKALNKKGMTIIYTSHYMEEVEQLCDRIYVMDHGKVIASGTKEDLKNLLGGDDIVSLQTDKASEGFLKELRGNLKVKNADQKGNSITLMVQKDCDILSDIFEAASRNGVKLKSLDIKTHPGGCVPVSYRPRAEGLGGKGMLISMIWKDLLVILKDKKSLIITLCMPAILTTILGFAFQSMMSGGFSMDRANIAVVSLGSREQDIERIKDFLESPNMEGRMSAEQREDLLELLGDMDFEKILYEDVLGSPEVGEFIKYERMGLDRAKGMLEKGELDAVVVLPEVLPTTLSWNLAMPFRNPVTIEVIKHPDRSIKGEMVSGIVKGFTDALSAGIIAKNVLETFIENNVGDKATREIQGLVSGMYDVGVRDVRVDRVTVEGKRALSSFQYYAVGMAVMFILYVAADGGQYAMDEVNNGTYRRLIAAGTGRWRFFASRFAATTLFAIMQFTVLKYYSAFAFKTDWGSPLGEALLSVFLAVAVGGLSVLLSALNLRLKNSRATIVFQAVVIQVFALLGGSFFPVSGIPVMRKLGSLTINGAAMSGFLKLMMGYGLAEVAVRSQSFRGLRWRLRRSVRGGRDEGGIAMITIIYGRLLNLKRNWLPYAL